MIVSADRPVGCAGSAKRVIAVPAVACAMRPRPPDFGYSRSRIARSTDVTATPSPPARRTSWLSFRRASQGGADEEGDAADLWVRRVLRGRHIVVPDADRQVEDKPDGHPAPDDEPREVLPAQVRRKGVIQRRGTLRAHRRADRSALQVLRRVCRGHAGQPHAHDPVPTERGARLFWPSVSGGSWRSRGRWTWSGRTGQSAGGNDDVPPTGTGCAGSGALRLRKRPSPQADGR